MELKLKEVKEIPKELKITLTPEETKKLNHVTCHETHDNSFFYPYELKICIDDKESAEVWKKLIYEIVSTIAGYKKDCFNEFWV